MKGGVVARFTMKGRKNSGAVACGGARAVVHDSNALIPVRWLGWTRESGWELVAAGAVAVGLPREATVAREGLGLLRVAKVSRGWSRGGEFGVEIDENL
ncbi:unnamed protein product [Sphenostylis stenocarpa]|uniref:Uncharacterized protein n=1 Tax=Sphenostylis stenocarpa TaxID=92480 RepID=A0AA86SMZ9_9FABA|nr:unnamed protein product [Sphenostylis stenocarpa]